MSASDAAPGRPMTVRILVADHVDIAGAARGQTDLDVVVVDLDGAESPAGALQLVCETVDAAVVALGTSDDPDVVRQVLAAGASAYLVKEDGHSHLLTAVRRAADGDRYLHPALELRLGADGYSEALSDRELDVLRLVVEGFTNREIAAELELSLRSIELLRARLREKLGVTSRGELIRYALDRGIARPER